MRQGRELNPITALGSAHNPLSDEAASVMLQYLQPSHGADSEMDQYYTFSAVHWTDLDRVQQRQKKKERERERGIE